MRRNFVEFEKNLFDSVAVEDTLDPHLCIVPASLFTEGKKFDDFLVLLSLTSFCCSKATRSLGYVEDSFGGNKKLTSDLL